MVRNFKNFKLHAKERQGTVSPCLSKDDSLLEKVSNSNGNETLKEIAWGCYGVSISRDFCEWLR